MKKYTESEMLHKMAAYCSVAEHCRQDIVQKMNAAGLLAEEQERILTKLISEKFLDEGRYAHAFVNDKIRFNQWGRVKISVELQKKKIPSSIIDTALADIDEMSYAQVLHTLLKSKLKNIKAKDDREQFYKLLRFALGRGFTMQEATVCIKEILSSGPTDINYETME